MDDALDMDEINHRKIYVGGISLKDTPGNVIKDHFSQYGEVLSVSMYSNRSSGLDFGFVTFRQRSSADKALRDDHRCLGRMVKLKRLESRHEHRRKVFVGGLPGNLTKEEFKNYFEKFGSATDVAIRHYSRKPGAYGFITFENEDAVNALLEIDFHELGGRRLELQRANVRDLFELETNDHSLRVTQIGQSSTAGSSYGFHPQGYNDFHGGGYPSEHWMHEVGPMNPWNGLQMGIYPTYSWLPAVAPANPSIGLPIMGYPTGFWLPIVALVNPWIEWPMMNCPSQHQMPVVHPANPLETLPMMSCPSEHQMPIV